MKWEEKYASLCEAPLQPIDKEHLDEDHPVMEFTHYWHGLNEGRIPDRSAFRPEAVPSLLRWIMILEQVFKAGKDEYLVRLQGTSIRRLAHLDNTGHLMHEFTSGQCYLSRLEAIRETIKIGQPGYARAIPGEGGEFSVEVFIGAFPFTYEIGGVQVFMVSAPSDSDLLHMI